MITTSTKISFDDIRKARPQVYLPVSKADSKSEFALTQRLYVSIASISWSKDSWSYFFNLSIFIH